MSSIAPVGDIRTLQWDTDPSVLQLQADSELGYIFLLLPLIHCHTHTQKNMKTPNWAMHGRLNT